VSGELVTAEIDRLVAASADADDVLRGVVAALVSAGGCAWAGILFVEAGELVRGPEAGSRRPDARLRLPVEFGGTRVAELVVDACPDAAVAEHVAASISELCLVGWDTGGVPWESLG